jgi:hypothetical protein
MITAEQIQAGKALAEAAGQAMYAKVGERDLCGFAEVKVYVDRTNSAQAKELIKAGFRKHYTPRCLIMSDPAGINTQSVSVKEAGAYAYANYLNTLGLKAYAGSNLD